MEIAFTLPVQDVPVKFVLRADVRRKAQARIAFDRLCGLVRDAGGNIDIQMVSPRKRGAGVQIIGSIEQRLEPRDFVAGITGPLDEDEGSDRFTASLVSLVSVVVSREGLTKAFGYAQPEIR